MEISHRSKELIQVADEFEQDFHVIFRTSQTTIKFFLSGGARAQFAAVP